MAMRFFAASSNSARVAAFGISRSNQTSTSAWSVMYQRGKKRRQRKLGIDDEVAPFSLGLLEEIEHPPHNHLPAIRLLARAHLGAADAQHSAHEVLLTRPPATPAG